MTSSHSPKIGVLLLNMGTPQAPTAAAVRTYLAQFLSDKRIVNLPSWLWKPILHGIILRTRPAKSALKYQRIWGEEGSPLLVHSARLCEAVQEQLDEPSKDKFVVHYAMRYGQPAIAPVLSELVKAGIERILVVPLYPQYSSTTAASALDAVYAWTQKQAFIPELRFINDYHNERGYIEALQKQIQQHWQQHGQAEKLLISFHGVPQSLIDSGDPYHAQCQQTASLLAQALGLSAAQYQVTFQSRFGKNKWLTPATATTLVALAAQGVQSVDVVCPGFSADCLETLEEINIECRHIFLNHGGTSFQYIPCLNATDSWVHALTNLIKRQVQGWLYDSDKNKNAKEADD